MAGESNWTLVHGPREYQEAFYAYGGQYMPSIAALQWLRANVHTGWRLNYVEDREVTECGLEIIWRGDFIGYEFQDPRDAVRFKLSVDV